jgi:hypothetical protein
VVDQSRHVLEIDLVVRVTVGVPFPQAAERRLAEIDKVDQSGYILQVVRALNIAVGVARNSAGTTGYLGIETRAIR